MSKGWKTMHDKQTYQDINKNKTNDHKKQIKAQRNRAKYGIIGVIIILISAILLINYLLKNK